MNKVILTRLASTMMLAFFFLGIPQSVDAVYQGVPAETGEFPWFVNLSGCGGVLVHPEWVLTARHCLGMDIGKQVSVRGMDETPLTATITRVLRYDASRPDMQNDIALAQISPALEDVPTVALPTLKDYQASLVADDLLVLGNGYTQSHYVSRAADQLPTLDDLSADNYTDWYKFSHERDGSVHHYNDDVVLKTDELVYSDYPATLLAGRNKAWESDLSTPGSTCFGDSGGGLIYSRPNPDNSVTPVVIGVTSAIDDCKNMAIRILFEEDGDNDPIHHTLPNGIKIPFPAWYERQVTNEMFGYTQHTNVLNPNWFERFLLCNEPDLDATERQTIVRGRLKSTLPMESDAFTKLMIWTSVTLFDEEGETVCMSAPTSDGLFTIYLPSDYAAENLSLHIKSRLIFVLEFPDSNSNVQNNTYSLIQDTYVTPTFTVQAKHDHRIPTIGMTHKENETVGLPFVTYDVLDADQPFVTRETVVTNHYPHLISLDVTSTAEPAVPLAILISGQSEHTLNLGTLTTLSVAGLIALTAGAVALRTRRGKEIVTD